MKVNRLAQGIPWLERAGHAPRGMAWTRDARSESSRGLPQVLEALSGVQFPRGTGLVTKCATEVRMRRCKKGQAESFKVSLSWSKPQPEEAGAVSGREDIGGKIVSLTERLLEDRGEQQGLLPGNKACFEHEHAIVVDAIHSLGNRLSIASPCHVMSANPPTFLRLTSRANTLAVSAE